MGLDHIPFVKVDTTGVTWPGESEVIGYQATKDPQSMQDRHDYEELPWWRKLFKTKPAPRYLIEQFKYTQRRN